MCFSGEDHLVPKPASPVVFQVPHTLDKELYIRRRSSDDIKIEEEILIKKRKILEDKAPGLFDYLTKFTAEEVSTETASSYAGELESEEGRHMIHIPTPLKTTSPQHGLFQSNLSNVVRVDVHKIGGESLPHIQLDSDGVNPFRFWQEKNDEEKQREQIAQMMVRNTIMLENSHIQSERLMKICRQCIESTRQLKNQLNENFKPQIERVENFKEEKKHSAGFDTNPTPTVLFNHLFGANQIYKYELVLDCELPVPIFRERNLILRAILIDALTRKPVKNNNKVLMHLALQTWEVPSNPILRNKTGNKAVMGETEVELKNGEVVFDRLQINEVTSKFIHGHIAIVIIPDKPVNHGTSMSDHEQGEGYISFDQIKPLMLEKVVVKSKKKKNPKKKSD